MVFQLVLPSFLDFVDLLHESGNRLYALIFRVLTGSLQVLYACKFVPLAVEHQYDVVIEGPSCSQDTRLRLIRGPWSESHTGTTLYDTWSFGCRRRSWGGLDPSRIIFTTSCGHIGIYKRKFDVNAGSAVQKHQNESEDTYQEATLDNPLRSPLSVVYYRWWGCPGTLDSTSAPHHVRRKLVRS